MQFKNGDEFSGEFKNSSHFMGVMTFKASGAIYKGEFNENGQFHGSGQLTNGDGDQYSGLFEYGLR